MSKVVELLVAEEESHPEKDVCIPKVRMVGKSWLLRNKDPSFCSWIFPRHQTFISFDIISRDIIVKNSVKSSISVGDTIVPPLVKKFCDIFIILLRIDQSIIYNWPDKQCCEIYSHTIVPTSESKVHLKQWLLRNVHNMLVVSGEAVEKTFGHIDICLQLIPDAVRSLSPVLASAWLEQSGGSSCIAGPGDQIGPNRSHISVRSLDNSLNSHQEEIIRFWGADYCFKCGVDRVLDCGGCVDSAITKDRDQFVDDEGQKNTPDKNGEDTSKIVGKLGFSVEPEELGTLKRVEIQKYLLDYSHGCNTINFYQLNKSIE